MKLYGIMQEWDGVVLNSPLPPLPEFWIPSSSTVLKSMNV